jgi:hypothetical protein
MRAHTLVFLHNGTVELHSRNGRVLWKSIQHPEFAEALGSFVSADESSAADILAWLVEHEYLDDAQADKLEIEEISIDSDEDEESEDEDYEDDADIDDEDEPTHYPHSHDDED